MTTVLWSRYDFVRSLIVRDFPPPADLLELGAAPGDQAVSLAKAGFRVTAVDLGLASDAWAGAEEGRMDSLFAAQGINSVRWNLEEVPYPLADESFDVVVMTEVYEHLREYPARSLVEVHRLLRPGGRLYFTTPNAAYLMNRIRLLRGHSVATPLPDWIGGLPHARHSREYTFGEIDELMAHAGLRVVERIGREFHLGSGPRRLMKKLTLAQLARLRPTLGPSVVCVAERRARDSNAQHRSTSRQLP